MTPRMTDDQVAEARQSAALRAAESPTAGRYVMVPTTGKASVAGLCAALYALALHDDCPAWVRGAAKELCRDFGVTPIPHVNGKPCASCGEPSEPGSIFCRDCEAIR